MLNHHINHTTYPDGKVVTNEPVKDVTESDDFLLMLDQYRKEYRRSRFIALFWEAVVILMILTVSSILALLIIAKSDHLQTWLDQLTK